MRDPLLWLGMKAGLVPRVRPDLEADERIAILERQAVEHERRIKAVERMFRARAADPRHPLREPDC